MTNPNQEDAQLTNLSDDYIRDLEPENQRYDITLAQDFVISVLPNGIKTWAFIYDFQGRHRRKTLGVFPEMNFEDAKVSLEKARASMLRMDEPTIAPNEFGQLPAVLGGGRYVPKRKKKPINLSFWLKLFAVLLAAAAIAFVVIKRPEWLPFQSNENESDDEPVSTSLPFAVNKPAEQSTQTPQTTTPESAPGTASASSEPSSEPARSISPVVTPPVAQPTTTPVTTRPGTSTTTPVAEPRTNTAQTVNVSPPPPPRTETKPVTTLTTTSTATAFGGRVARSRLTSRVQDLEPVDTIGPEISYKNSGFTRVFYFTELREFGDGNVVHRWSLNGEIQEEVSLKVKRSWRWRTYSNKDITPGLNGEWKIETIDATGKILDTETFTYDYQ